MRIYTRDAIRIFILQTTLAIVLQQAVLKQKLPGFKSDKHLKGTADLALDPVAAHSVSYCTGYKMKVLASTTHT